MSENSLTFIVGWSVTLIAVGALMTHCSAGPLPDAVLVEANHTSQIEQHFGPNRSDFGYTSVAAFLHWDLPRNGYLDIGDGHTVYHTFNGLHDLFQARVGVRINLWK